jgi:hypothetical protein
MNADLAAGYAIAAFSLSVNMLLEEVSNGRITAQDAQAIITRSRSLGSLIGLDPTAQTAADGLLASAGQMLTQLSTPPQSVP